MLLLTVSLAGVGCRDAREQALLELERRGISATPAALETAVRQKELLVIGFLGTAGVKAAVPDAGQASVLHLATGMREWDLADRLVPFADPAVVNHPGPKQLVVLEEVVAAGQWPLAKKLLAAGARPEAAACGVDELVRAAAGEASLMDDLLSLLPQGHAALTPALLRAVRANEEIGRAHV